MLETSGGPAGDSARWIMRVRKPDIMLQDRQIDITAPEAIAVIVVVVGDSFAAQNYETFK
ncbi:MAG: hypothetical protein DHS20C06_16430 [Hyphobacterium sp.]|nr:MAG: hypothetical protein DHS20C06_16430 [Hyphobacterium sp.]